MVSPIALPGGGGVNGFSCWEYFDEYLMCTARSEGVDVLRPSGVWGRSLNALMQVNAKHPALLATTTSAMCYSNSWGDAQGHDPAGGLIAGESLHFVCTISRDCQ